MNDNIAKYTKILLWVLFALSAFFSLMLFIDTSETETGWIDKTLVFSKILLYVAAAATILSFIYHFTVKLIEHPKKAMISIISFVLIAIILMVSFIAASDEILNMPNYKGEDNIPEVIKWTGTGFIMMYILLGIAVLSIIYVEISRLFK